MTYNPLKEFIPPSNEGHLPYINIERDSYESGEDWLFHKRLIENMLRHFEEVADCFVDPDGTTVYITLENDIDDQDELDKLEFDLHYAIGRIACFSYTT